MKKSIRHTLVLLSWFGLLLCGPNAFAAELLRPPPTTVSAQASEAIRKVASQPHVVRSDKVAVNLDAGLATVITVTLPSGKVLTLRKAKEIRHDPTSYTWAGSVDGEPLGNAVLSFSNGRLVGNVNVPGFVYAIEPVDGSKDAYLVKVIDLSRLPRGNPTPPRAPVTPSASSKSASQSAAPAGAAGDAVIDVLFLYTDAAYAALGPNTYLANNGQLIIDRANLTYEGHGFPFRLRSVGMVKAGFTEMQTASPNGLLDALYQVNGLTDVSSLRDTKGADIVVLIGRDEGYSACGIAFVGGGERYAQAVLDHRCLNGTAFLHELGHLMGSWHDEETNPTAPASSGLGFRSKGVVVNGVTNLATCFHTVMAYQVQCTNSPYYSTPLFLFSNPNGRVGGVPIGNARANNNLFFRTSGPPLANYRSPPAVNSSDRFKRALPSILYMLE